MSTVDISALGQLTPSQPLDFNQYPSAAPKPTDGAKFTLPPAGEYTLRVPVITAENFTVAKASGALMLNANFEIVGPTHTGTAVRYVRLSAKTFDREGQQVSLLGDLVKAAGGGTMPGVTEDGNAQAQADAVSAISGREFKAYLNWEAEDRKYGSGIKVRGMSKFPETTNTDGTTTRQSFIEIPGQKDAQGRSARAWANLYIGNFVV